MCDPLTVLLIGGSLAASVGGNIISRNEADADAAARARARNEQLRETMRKNDRLAEASRQQFSDRAEAFEPKKVSRDLDEAQDIRGADLARSVPKFDPGSIPISGSAPKVVKSEIAKRMLDVFEQGKSQAQRAGALGGYGDFFFNQGLANTDAANNIGVTNNFAQGNLALLPHLQDFAEIEAHKPSSGIGEILSGVGRIGATAAGGGYFG